MKHYNCESFCYCCYQIYLLLWIRKVSIFEWPGDRLLNHHNIRCISEELCTFHKYRHQNIAFKYSLADFPLSPSKSLVAKMWPLKEMNRNNKVHPTVKHKRSNFLCKILSFVFFRINWNQSTQCFRNSSILDHEIRG